MFNFFNEFINKLENRSRNFNIGNERIQKFISEFSVPFTQPYDFDNVIDNALFELRDFTVTDRAIILEFQPDGSLLCTHENIINDKTPKLLGRSLAYEAMQPILHKADKTGCFYEKAAVQLFNKHPDTSLDEKSFCYIPLTIGGNRTGYLVFFTMFKQANWTEGEFRLATMAGSIIAGAYSRKKSENIMIAAKEAELRTQEFISKFSVPFTQPYDFDELIENALFELRSFTVTDRAIILEFQSDGSLVCSHENVINNIPNVLGRSLSHETIKPILDEADKTGCFYEKEALHYFKRCPDADLGEKSFCYIPLMVEGERAGYLVFATILEQANWTEGEFQLASMAGSILAGAFSMRKSENALKEATLKAQQASIAKSIFLSNMSHEIRTPMNAILGMTQIAAKTTESNKLKKCIETIENSSNQLLSIINDVLDISKIESGKLVLNEVLFSLERIIIKSCSLISTKANDKGIKILISTNENLHLRYVGDDIRISQILSNLLSNAVKFTPEGGLITVSAEEIQRPNDNRAFVRVSVEDSGIGMTGEQLSRIFNSFEQADGSISRQYGGTGLGLAITKSLAEKMGGSVEVESVYGKGSKFIVNLQLNRVDKEETDVANFIKTQFENLNVLIISNSSRVVSKLTALVKRFNLFCDVADNFVEAKSLVQMSADCGHPYCVVFFDFNLHDDESLRIYPFIENITGNNAVVLITEYGMWDVLSCEIDKYGIKRNLEMPLFASSLYDTLSSIVYDKKTHGVGRYADVDLDLSGVTVLLAEDVEINQMVFTALLEDTGIHIDCAENGGMALEMFQKSPDKFDIIVMDVQMPIMNGLEATRAIRMLNVPRAQTVPIIAMTANAFKEDADECIAAGMNDHLAKPIDFDALLTVLKKWIS